MIWKIDSLSSVEPILSGPRSICMEEKAYRVSWTVRPFVHVLGRESKNKHNVPHLHNLHSGDNTPSSRDRRLAGPAEEEDP